VVVFKLVALGNTYRNAGTSLPCQKPTHRRGFRRATPHVVDLTNPDEIFNPMAIDEEDEDEWGSTRSIAVMISMRRTNELDGEMSMTDGSIDAQHQTQSPPSFVDANLM